MEDRKEIPRSKGRLRRAVWLALCLVVIGGGLLLVLPEVAARQIARIVTKTTGRHAAVETAQFRGLHQIILRDLRIYHEDPADGVFLSTPEVKLDYNLANLTKPDSLLTSAVAHGGHIDIVLLPDGKWNIPKIRRLFPDKPPNPITDIDIYAATVNVDGLGPDGGAPTLSVSVPQCRITEESLEEPIEFRARALIGRAEVPVSGTIGKAEDERPISFHAEAVPAGLLVAAFPANLPFEATAGDVTVNASWSKEDPLRWNAAFEEAAIQFRGDYPTLTGASGYVRGVSGGEVLLEKAWAFFPGAEVSVSGRAYGGAGLDLGVTAKADLAPLAAGLAEAGTISWPEGLTPGGTADVQISITRDEGAARGWTFDGNAKLDEAGLAHPNWPEISGLSGTINFAESGLAATGLAANLSGYPLVVSGKLTDFSDPHVDITECEGTLDLESLGSIPAQYPTTHGSMLGVLHFSARLAGMVADRSTWTGNAHVSSARAAMFGFELEAVETDLGLAGGTLDVSNFGAVYAGGPLQGEATMHLLGDRGFEAGLLAHAVDLREITLSLGVDQTTQVFGYLYADCRLRGTLGTADDLSGEIRLSVEEGDLRGLSLLRGIGAFLSLDFLETARVDRAKGTFTLRSSVFETADLTFNCRPDVATFVTPGWVDTSGQMSFTVATLMPESLADRVPFLLRWPVAIVRSAGRVLVPTVLVTGTLREPRYLPVPVVGGIQGVFEDVLRGLGMPKKDEPWE